MPSRWTLVRLALKLTGLRMEIARRVTRKARACIVHAGESKGKMELAVGIYCISTADLTVNIDAVTIDSDFQGAYQY